MAQQVPELFDAVKMAHALTRAKRKGAERFLLDHVAMDLSDRLATVKRDFSSVLDVGTPFAAFGERVARMGGMLPQRVGIARTDEPFEDGAHDLVLSGMVFHHINDLPGLMIRLRRALRPDGLMLAAFPGGDTVFELRDALFQAEIELTGNASLRTLPMIDVRTAGQLLQRAGFALPVVDSEKVIVRYSSLMRLINDLRAMAGTAAILKRDPTPQLTQSIFARAAALYAANHADQDGKLRATFEIIWMSGWAPHASQQQPLKPGAAKTRLADALQSIAQGNDRTRS